MRKLSTARFNRATSVLKAFLALSMARKRFLRKKRAVAKLQSCFRQSLSRKWATVQESLRCRVEELGESIAEAQQSLETNARLEHRVWSAANQEEFEELLEVHRSHSQNPDLESPSSGLSSLLTKLRRARMSLEKLSAALEQLAELRIILLRESNMLREQTALGESSKPGHQRRRSIARSRKKSVFEPDMADIAALLAAAAQKDGTPEKSAAAPKPAPVTPLHPPAPPNLDDIRIATPMGADIPAPPNSPYPFF